MTTRQIDLARVLPRTSVLVIEAAAPPITAATRPTDVVLSEGHNGQCTLNLCPRRLLEQLL